MKATLARTHGTAEVMSAWASSQFEAGHWAVQGDEEGCSWEPTQWNTALGVQSCSILPVTALHCCLQFPHKKESIEMCDTPFHSVFTSPDEMSSGPFLQDRRRILLRLAFDIHSPTNTLKCPIVLLPAITIKAWRINFLCKRKRLKIFLKLSQWNRLSTYRKVSNQNIWNNSHPPMLPKNKISTPPLHL